MSRIFLLRHAQSIANEKGILAGRMESVALSKKGLDEREALEQRLSGAKFDQILSSPIQRCVETIINFYSAPKMAHEFQEVDYGDWTGKKMSSLARICSLKARTSSCPSNHHNQPLGIRALSSERNRD